MKTCLEKSYEKLTEDYLYSYKGFKYHPYPEKLDFCEWGDATAFGNNEIMFSGTDTLKLVDADYFLIFFKEIAHMDPAMPFDFYLNYNMLEGSFDMHINYDGYGNMRHMFFNSLNSEGLTNITCPECGRDLDFHAFPEWFDPYYCPNCDAELTIREDNPGLEIGWEDEDIISDYLEEKLEDYKDHQVGDIAEKNMHVHLIAEGKMDKDLLSQYSFIYDDVVSDTTDLIIIGSHYWNYSSTYGCLLDVSKAVCKGDDRSNKSNWYIDDTCITDLWFRIVNTKTAPNVIGFIKSLYENGCEIPFLRLVL